MDVEKYNRSVTLLCPTCGSSQFEFGDAAAGNGPIRCPSCDRTFTRDELIRENGEIIETNVDEVKAEIVADVRKELTHSLKKAFGNSKHIKFR